MPAHDKAPPFRSTLHLLATLALAGAAHGATISLTPVADAEIREASPLAPFGTGSTMVSGGLGANADNTRRRALLRFELTDAIPAGATVTSVELTVHAVLQLPPTLASSNFELHRLLRPWRESAVTWNWADGPTAPWGTPGAGRNDDTEPAASASVTVTGLGTYSFASTPALVADVQEWIDNPAANAGWLLRSHTESPYTARHFGTRENTTSPARLTISYEPPPPPLEPVTMVDMTAQNGEVRFLFFAKAGVAYRVEFRHAAAAGDWQTLTNMPAATTDTLFEVLHAASSNASFYRVETVAAP